MERVVLSVAPFQGLPVQVGHVPEGPSREEIALDKPDQPLDLALGVRMPGLAELRLEADGLQKGLVFPVPDGLSVQIPVVHDAFHVVGQDIFRDAHAVKRADKSDEQILLLGVGEKLDEHRTAVMAAEREAGDLVLVAAFVQDLYKTPVHLERLAGLRFIPHPSAALRVYHVALGGDQVLMRGDILLNGGDAAGEADIPEPFQADRRVRDAAHEQRVKRTREACKPLSGRNLAGITVGKKFKPVLL